MKEILENAKIVRSVRRQTYPGAYRWRRIPELEAEWIGQEARWLVSSIEGVSLLNDPIEVLINEVHLDNPKDARDYITAKIARPILNCRKTRKLIYFRVELSENYNYLNGSLSILINRCWDGIRILPYTSKELITCMSVTCALLIGRAEAVGDIDQWEKIIFGDLELIEVAPVGGHIEAGDVSRDRFLGAIRAESLAKMTKYMQIKAKDDIDDLLMYVVDTWLLFDFKLLKSLFIEEFVPSSISSYWREDLELYAGSLGCLWSPTFNPALLGYLTIASYRFRSPIGYDHGSPQIIYIFTDMSNESIEEAFYSCIPNVLSGKKPYQVRFHGFSFDERPLWKIPSVVEQAKFIVQIGGISVLDVFSSIKMTSPTEEDHLGLKESGGLGAFEIWLMSKNLIDDMQGKEIDMQSPLVKSFWNELMISNSALETKARKQSDWPGTV